MRDWLKVGILGLLGILPFNLESKSQEIPIVIDTPVQEIFHNDLQEIIFRDFYIDPNALNESYDAIEKVLIQKFLDNYISSVTPHSENFQKYEIELGREGLLDRYGDTHRLCLDLAFENPNPNEDDFYALGRGIAERQQELGRTIDSPANYLDNRVVNEFVDWGRMKTLFFNRLFENVRRGCLKFPGESQENYVRRLVQWSYTEEEYREYIGDFNTNNDQIYEGVRCSLGFLRNFFGSEQIHRELGAVSGYSNEAYEGTIEQFYSFDESNSIVEN